jgi:hypothetical protein
MSAEKFSSGEHVPPCRLIAPRGPPRRPRQRSTPGHPPLPHPRHRRPSVADGPKCTSDGQALRCHVGLVVVELDGDLASDVTCT